MNYIRFRFIALLCILLHSLCSFAITEDEVVWDFEWLEPNNKIEIVVGEPYQIKFACSSNRSKVFTQEYATNWVHYDFSPMQHIVSPPTGYSIDTNGTITGLVPGKYAMKFTGKIQAKSGTDAWLYITVVSERTEKESNNTFDTANDIYSKIRFGLSDNYDVDFFRFAHNKKAGEYIKFKIHYYGTREAPFGYKWTTFCGTQMVGSGSLLSQDQECNALVASSAPIYLKVYYNQSYSQYFNYGEEFVAEVITDSGSTTQEECSLSISAIGNGSVYYDGKVIRSNTINNSLTQGASAAMTFVPDDGYRVKSVMENGLDVTSKVLNNQYIISSISSNTSIEVVFETKPSIISFADANVKAICVANWDTNGDGELSEEEAATVKNLGKVFQKNTKITSFDELRYFGINSIDDYAFLDCSGLNFVTIPSSVTSIGLAAFADCSGLSSVTIPSSVTSIGNGAFASCSGLTSVTIPSRVTSIGDEAFYGCSSLNTIIVDLNNVTYDSRDNCNAIIRTATNTLIAGCKNTIIPNSVTSIGNGAFVSCSGLTSVTIPSSVKSIGDRAFNGCSGLTSVTIPSSVTSIGKSAFAYCSSLTSVTIPSGVTSIGSSAFWYCSNLTAVTIPSSVTSIGEFAFDGCSGLTSVTVDIFQPLNITQHTFSNRANVTLYVPAGSKAAYEAATYWKQFREIIEIGSNVKQFTLSITSIGNGSVLYNNTSIRSKTSSFPIDEGSSATISFTPDEGYIIKCVKANNIDVTLSISNNQYTVSNISSNTNIEVEFEAIPPTTYTLAVSAMGNGYASYDGTTVRNEIGLFTVNEGTNATITFIPDNGYRIKCVDVNDTDVTSSVSNNQLIISSISDYTKVNVTFEAIPTSSYTLTIKTNQFGKVGYFYTTDPSPGADHTEYKGTVTSEYSRSVVKGGAVTLYLYPNDGCKLASLVVNGKDVTSSVSNQQYTISDISNDLSIIATFDEASEPKPQIDGHEYVDLGLPSGKLWATVNYGANQPEEYGSYVYWSATDIISSSWGENWITPTLADVRELESNCTWTWSTKNGVNGFTVKGKNGNTIFIPAAGVEVGKVMHAGEWCYYWTSTKDTDYNSMTYIIMATASNVAWGSLNTDYSLIPIRPVSKEGKEVPPTTYTLTIKATGNGAAVYDGTTIRSKSSAFTVNEGSSSTITFTPDAGYRIKSVKVNGSNVTSSVSNNRYTVSNINKDTSVEVEFEAIPPTTYTLSIKSTGSGTAAYGGSTIRSKTSTFTVNEWSSAVITFTPDAGYRLKSVKVNSSDVTSSVSNNRYTVSNIRKNTTVEVEFEAIPPTTYSLTIKATGRGSVSYSGKTIRNNTNTFTEVGGNTAIITFTPDTGYRIKSVKVNGVLVASDVSTYQYTVSNINSDTTVEVEFMEQLMAFSSNGVNYSVASYDDRTVMVGSGNYGKALEVPANVSYQEKTWKVTGIDNAAIADNARLAAVIWNAETQFTPNVSNPNFLLYVKSADYAPSTVKNVVVNGSAKSITLTEAPNGNDFYCPQEFTAQRISYTHNYMMTTGIGESRGWETIALPFDVQQVTHQSGGELVPFAKWQSGNEGKPFWLMELGGSGWTEATAIKANTPYIISMPNNENYKPEFRVNGNVTFKAENVTVRRSDEMESRNGNGKTFVPNFTNQESAGYYALNVSNDYVTYSGGAAEGSRFVAGLRPVRPFEAYMTSEAGVREIAITDDLATGIAQAIVLIGGRGDTKVYDLKGRVVADGAGCSQEELRRMLPYGVYIFNGRKLIVK